MAASFNKVVLLGNMTRDVELKYTQSNTAVTEIGLAINDRVKRGEEWVDEVTFVDITLWGRTAEIAGEYLGKGSQVMVEGRLKLDQWEQDGQKRSKLRVTCERLVMLGSKRDGGQEGGGQGRQGGSKQGSDTQGGNGRGSSGRQGGQQGRSQQGYGGYGQGSPSNEPEHVYSDDEIPF